MLYSLYTYTRVIFFFSVQDLYSGLLDYLKEKRIDETFATEILVFYQAFEHQCYVRNFLEEVKTFCSID